MSPNSDAPILFFDGVCNVCAASVQFVLAHERAPTLRFASLQSPLARDVLPPLGINPEDLDSLVLVEDGRAAQRSTAAIAIARHLRAPWSWLRALWIVPRPLRDFAYDLFASQRYRLFGKKDECFVPTPALRARFL